MACTTHCTICGSCYEAFSEETANEPGRRCPRCVMAATLVSVQEKMRAAAVLMTRHGWDNTQGRGMRAATRLIGCWVNEVGRWINEIGGSPATCRRQN
jgi:hypothetical protein